VFKCFKARQVVLYIIVRGGKASLTMKRQGPGGLGRVRELAPRHRASMRN
jgi:hypothetical protein